MDRLTWITAHNDEIINTYKHLHTIPELAHQEFKTAAFLAEELRRAGLEVEEQAEGTTGVLAVLRGSEPGPVLGIRADMDALPLEEQTGLPFASTHPGRMHACGHDAHSAIVLWTAKALAALGIKRGTVKCIFQPAEETLTGARRFLKTGKLDDVQEMFSLHLRPRSEAKFGEAAAGIAHSASCPLKVTLTGKSSHGARPHQGCNAAEAAGLIVNAVGLVHCDPRVTHSAKCTGILADTGVFNIIPDKAILRFDLRAQTNEVMEDQLAKVTRAIEQTAAALGVAAAIEIVDRCPAASLDPGLVADAARAITEVLGGSLPVVEVPASEDFHIFAVEGGMRTTLVGIGTDAETHHHPEVTYNLGAVPIGVKIMTTLLHNKLS